MPSGVDPATDANYRVDAITPAADLALFEVTLVGGPQPITVPDGMAEVQVKHPRARPRGRREDAHH